MPEITKAVAEHVLRIVDAGLVQGMGQPVAGAMCVEAAVCFALNEPFGDSPSCVSPALRAFKIALNDAAWPSNAARAKGLRRLALAQLGSKDALDDVEFVRRLAMMAVNITVPRALRAAAARLPAEHSATLLNKAVKCETAFTLEAAWALADAAAARAAKAARAAAWALADAAAQGVTIDRELEIVAEAAVQILIAMNAPGIKWLYLTEAPVI